MAALVEMRKQEVNRALYESEGHFNSDDLAEDEVLQLKMQNGDSSDSDSDSDSDWELKFWDKLFKIKYFK